MNIYPILLLATLSNANLGRLDQVLTLDEAIRSAELHSDAVRQAKDALIASKARVGQQNALRNPQLGLVGSAVQYDNPSSVRFGGMTIQEVPDHTETLSLQLNQIIDLSNQIGTAVSQTKLTALSTDYAYSTTLSDVALTTTLAYVEALRADQNVEVERATLTAYQEQLKLNTNLYQGGTGPKINVLRAQSQVSSAESELVRRQNASRAARSKLNDLIGKSLDEKVGLANPNQNGGSAGDPFLSNPAGGPNAEDHSALIAIALDRRTEVLGSLVQVKAAEKGIKLARSSADPQVSIGLSGNYFPTTSFQQVRQTTAALTLGVTIPLYDGGLAKDRVHEAKAVLDSARANADQVRRSVALEVQNAALDVETSRKRVLSAKVAVDAASAARDLAQQRYEAQVSLYLEVTDAQSALTTAQGALVETQYDLLNAEARLARSLGEGTIPRP